MLIEWCLFYSLLISIWWRKTLQTSPGTKRKAAISSSHGSTNNSNSTKIACLLTQNKRRLLTAGHTRCYTASGKELIPKSKVQNTTAHRHLCTFTRNSLLPSEQSHKNHAKNKIKICVFYQRQKNDRHGDGSTATSHLNLEHPNLTWQKTKKIHNVFAYPKHKRRRDRNAFNVWQPKST